MKRIDFTETCPLARGISCSPPLEHLLSQTIVAKAIQIHADRRLDKVPNNARSENRRCQRRHGIVPNVHGQSGAWCWFDVHKGVILRIVEECCAIVLEAGDAPPLYSLIRNDARIASLPFQLHALPWKLPLHDPRLRLRPLALGQRSRPILDPIEVSKQPVHQRTRWFNDDGRFHSHPSSLLRLSGCRLPWSFPFGGAAQASLQGVRGTLVRDSGCGPRRSPSQCAPAGCCRWCVTANKAGVPVHSERLFR